MQGLQTLVANQSRHLREPGGRMTTQQIDDAFAVGPTACRSESGQDREICLAGAELLEYSDACWRRRWHQSFRVSPTAAKSFSSPCG